MSLSWHAANITDLVQPASAPAVGNEMPRPRLHSSTNCKCIHFNVSRKKRNILNGHDMHSLSRVEKGFYFNFRGTENLLKQKYSQETRRWSNCINWEQRMFFSQYIETLTVVIRNSNPLNFYFEGNNFPFQSLCSRVLAAILSSKNRKKHTKKCLCDNRYK